MNLSRDYAIDLITIKNVSYEFRIDRDVNRYSNTLPIEWNRIVSQSTKKILLLQKPNDLQTKMFIKHLRYTNISHVYTTEYRHFECFSPDGVMDVHCQHQSICLRNDIRLI